MSWNGRHQPTSPGETVGTAVLFDLDGTLLDHASASRGALEDLYRQHHAHIRLVETDFLAAWAQASSAHFGQHEHGKLTYAQQGRLRIRAAFGNEAIEDDTASRYFADFVDAYESRWTLFPDVLPCLELLQDRPLGIITNGNPQQQRKKLRTLGLDRFFKTVLISSEFGAAKPAPGIFLEAVRRLGSSPSRSLVVGDSWEHDILGARNAGMQAAWLNRTAQPYRQGIPNLGSLEGLQEILDLVAPGTPASLDRAA